MLVHRSNFLLENTFSSLYSFNSSLQNRDEIVILHYSSLNLLTFTNNTFTSSICWIFLVLINLFRASSSMGWTSLFDKFKLVCIFLSMCWTYWIFVRPWIGHVEFLLVHGLDVLKTLFSFIQGFYLVFYLDEFGLLWRAYWRFISVVQRIFPSMDLALLFFSC